NEEIIADKILEMGVIHKNISRRKLILEVEDLLNRYYSSTLDELDISSIAEDLQRLFYKFHIKMPQEFLILMRALAVSEGVGTSLDPNFNIFKMKDRFLKDIISDRLKVTNMANRFFSKLWKIKTLSKDLPEDLRSLLEKLANDEFSIKFEHENLEPLIKKLDIVSNRLSVSLIVSALLMGSSMVLQSDIGPHIFSIPLLGFLGYTSAGILGLWLVVTIFKSGKF
ncbi:MAG: AarF/ABC1/UbiB kinase family protein, partial [Bacillota bacterium]